MKALVLTLCVVLSCTILICSCKSTYQTQQVIIDDNPELKEMVRKDQEIRQNDTLDWEPIDQTHRERVMWLLANGKVRTNEDKLNASLLLQHTALTFCSDELKSISPENYLMAHQLARSAFEGGEKGAAYMTAVTYDRYLLYTAGYQKYGTQRVPDEVTGEEVWAPIDTKTTDEERAKYNVPSLKELLKKYRMKPFKDPN